MTRTSTALVVLLSAAQAPPRVSWRPHVSAVISSITLFSEDISFEPAPLLLGFVLGPMMEEQLRRTMLLSRGDPMVFLERPISATLLAITALIIVIALYSSARTRRRTLASTLASSRKELPNEQ